MKKLTMCRICLAQDVRMHLINATHLHKMYEALTTMPVCFSCTLCSMYPRVSIIQFETEDSRPLQVCYICCARLQNCYKLKMRCLQSEELFSQMLNKEVELTGGPSKEELSVVQVVHMSFDVVEHPTLCNQVKVELEDFEATTSDNIVDGDRDEHLQFSNIEDQEMIDIIKHEPDEDTSSTCSRSVAPPSGEVPRHRLAPRRRLLRQFVALEKRRLQLEADRERRHHDREMERLRAESRTIEMEEDENLFLNRIVNTLNNLIAVLPRSRPSSLPSTDNGADSVVHNLVTKLK